MRHSKGADCLPAKLMDCTCGQEGHHWHTLDGGDMHLCGRCNAVLLLIQQNMDGLPVDFVLTNDMPDEDGKSIVDRWSEIDASDSRKVKAQPLQAVTASPSKDPVFPIEQNQQQFFVPIGPNDGEVLRTVPEFSV